jgi:hypothetical protein
MLAVTSSGDIFQEKPIDTYPYYIRVEGTAGSDLEIIVNGVVLASDLSFESSFVYGMDAGFLYNSAPNLLRVSSSSTEPIVISLTRGDRSICSFAHPVSECEFEASVAYRLLDQPEQSYELPCADEDFLQHFFASLDLYQTLYARRFFALDEEGIDQRCDTSLEGTTFPIAAEFHAAPSPREALHAPLGAGRLITFATRPDIVQALKIAAQGGLAGPAGVLIFDLADERRVLPVLDARRAYTLMTQTR